jgi:hypothetical protein
MVTAGVKEPSAKSSHREPPRTGRRILSGTDGSLGSRQGVHPSFLRDSGWELDGVIHFLPVLERDLLESVVSVWAHE